MADEKPFEPVPTELDFPSYEQKVLDFWKERRIFEKSLELRGEGAPHFVFYEGPPTANGVPHNGHVLTRVVKDLFPRYQSMLGQRVLRKGGWDTHGLPVEVEVSEGRLPAAVEAAYARGELPARAGATFAYMFSAHQHLGDVGAWHPHMMVFVPYADRATVGDTPFGGKLPTVTDDAGGDVTGGASAAGVSGDSVRAGLAGLLLVVLALGPEINWWPLLAYLVLNIAYSRWLKQVPLLDVFVVAAGFLLRMIQGYVALAVPALVRSLGRWNDDPLVRFAALGFLATQIMFLLFPWKPAHLLPSLLTLVLWIAASERNRRPYLWVLVAAVAVNGLFAVRVLAPDRPDASRSARFASPPSARARP